MNRVFLLTVLVLVIFVDQIIKFIILNYMLNNFNEVNLLPFMNFILVLNSGVAFGILGELGKQAPIVLSFFAILLAALLCFWSLYKKQSFFAIGLIAGGAIGNAIDRLRIGAVVDFIDIYWQNLHWPAFNFADISISIGVCLLVIKELFFKERAKNNFV